jgi:hypothetical protein
MDQPASGRDWRHALVLKADNADWMIREAAWSFEERVLWRGSDVSREVFERVSPAIRPLQRLIQTKLTWPLSCALRERRPRTRAALAASTAALAIAAGVGGAITAPHDSDSAARAAATPPSAAAAIQAQANTPVLQGVTPKFEPTGAPAPPPEPPSKSSAPPAQVAWQFAQAFVGYEVGHPGKQVDQVFATTATKQLAKALSSDPPRLPAKGKVPQARVLNVILGARGKKQVTASVSLVRLRAISELRLTLTKSGESWRVAQVLG